MDESMGLNQLNEPAFEDIYYDNRGGDYMHKAPSKYISRINPNMEVMKPNVGKQEFYKKDK